MIRWFERLARHHLGIERLTFRPTPRFRRRILIVSALPLLDVAVLLTDLYIDFRFDTFGFGSAGVSDEVPDAWQRISLVTSVLQTYITTLSVAILFLFGLGKWERWEGSWMLLIGTTLVAASAVFGTAAAVTSAFGFEKAFDLRSFTWSGWAARLALLAFGYLFIAHRALTLGEDRFPVRRYRRRRIRPESDSESAPGI